MKRWTLRILFCLIVGVVTTVAVAWGLVIRMHLILERTSITQTDSFDGVAYKVSERWARRHGIDVEQSIRLAGEECILHVWGHEARFVGANRMDFRMLPVPVPSIGVAHIGSRIECGWPSYSFQADLFDPNQYAPYLPADSHRKETGALTLHDGATLLPTRPILPGFIINTLFYAAICFVLLFSFGFVRRMIRRKRGRCPRCGYDLRGDDAGCPECGLGRT